MPVLPGFGNPTTTTVQQVLNCTAQDVRQLLSGTANPGQTILLDYCNRMSLMLLRASNWKFLLSAPQRFITQLQQTDYWIGNIGGNPAGTVDTGLGLSNVGRIKEGSVFDRSNFRNLGRTDEPPLADRISFGDGTMRPDRPRVWRNSPDTPYVLNVYPAPDNQNTYQPIPESPYCQITAGGALPARTYFVRVSFVDSAGLESAASGVNAATSTQIFVPANFLLLVNPPQEPLIGSSSTGVTYNRYNVYASVTQGSECLQTVSPLSTTAQFTESLSGLSTGTTIFPTTNNITKMFGYLIEFRYFQTRTQLTTLAQVLQIPDDYKDVMCAGVNWMAFQYLDRKPEAQEWKQIYMSGISQIIRDKNLTPRGEEFIRPDGASLGNKLPTIETLDPTLLRSQ